MINLLLEIAPIAPDGTIKSLHLCSRGAGSKSVQINGYNWLPLITKKHARIISWSDEGVLGETSISYEPLVFEMSNEPGINNEIWSTYQWQGAYCRMWLGNDGDDFSSYVQTYEGSAGAIEREGPNASLPLLSTDFLLDRNLLSRRYAGTDATGGPEGPAALRGTLKPYAAGICANVQPILVDRVAMIYQYHGYGPTAGISAIFENALDFGPPAATATTWAALAALTLADGTWAAAPAIGAFRLANQPTGTITADVFGAQDGNTFPTTVGTIIPMLIKATGLLSDRIAPSLASRNESWNLYADSQTTVGEELKLALKACGCAAIPTADGKYAAMDFYNLNPTPVKINSDQSVNPIVRSYKQLAIAPPVWQVVVSGERSWHEQSESEISQAVAIISAYLEAKEIEIKAAKDAADLAQAQADAQKRRVDDIQSDGILDRSEKADQNRRYTEESSIKVEMMNKSTSFDVTDQRGSYLATYNNLSLYLNSLSPSFFDLTQNTPITTAYGDYWMAYELAKVTLANAMTGNASLTATWGGVSGSGKPADGATVGGTIGTDVKNSDGTIYVPPSFDAIQHEIEAEVQKAKDAIALVEDGLKTDISSAKSDATTARSDATTARSNAAKVASDLVSTAASLRADDAAQRQSIADLKSVNGDGAVALVRDEAKTRADADTAAANRISTVEISITSGPNNLASLSGRISDEATTRSQNETAIAGRITAVTTKYDSALASINTRISDEATARSSADGALSDRIQTVSADYITTAKATDIATKVAVTKVTDEATARANADGALSDRIQTVAADYTTAGKATDIATKVAVTKVTDEATARANADGALSSRLQTVEASYTTADAAASVAQAKVNSEATTRANADNALSTRLDSVSATFGTVNARIDAEATTRATAVDAVASTTRALTAKLNSNPNLLLNSSGENGGINSGLPNSWSSAGNWFINQSPYWGTAMQCDGPQIATFSVDSPRIPCFPGAWYTASADMLMFSDYSDAVSWVDIAFVRSNGQITYGNNRPVAGPHDFNLLPTFRDATAVSAQAPSDAVSVYLRGVFYSNSGWPKNVGIRQAKLEAGQTATAYSMEGSAQNSSTRITNTETTVANGFAASTSRMNLMVSEYGGISAQANARIGNEEVTRANAVSALSSRTNSLSAQVLSPGANLMPNSSGETDGILTGRPNQWISGGGTYSYKMSSSWGPIMSSDGYTNTNIVSFDSPRIACTPGQAYTASADLILISFDAGNSCFCYIDICFVLSDGSISYANNGRPVYGSRDFGSPGFRDATWCSAMAPANAVQVLMRGVFARPDAGGRHQIIGLRQAKLEASGGPYAAYTTDANNANTAARVTTTESAVANINGRVAAYWQVQAVAGNNRAQMTVHADANGGAGVDIVGDVAITGQNGAGRTVINGSGVQVFDANGVLRVRMGLF